MKYEPIFLFDVIILMMSIATSLSSVEKKDEILTNYHISLTKLTGMTLYVPIRLYISMSLIPAAAFMICMSGCLVSLSVVIAVVFSVYHNCHGTLFSVWPVRVSVRCFLLVKCTTIWNASYQNLCTLFIHCRQKYS